MRLHHKESRLVLSIMITLLGIFMIYQGITTYRAHNTFEGYCKRRGLVVVNKEADYGYCKNLSTGKEFKIVLFKDRRYLDGDLPCGFLCL